MGLCKICRKKCTLGCIHCQKVYYCCHDHLLQDKANHKLDCFPARLVYDARSDFYYYEATRNIKQDELIFKETSEIAGPSPYSGSTGNAVVRLCLACNKPVAGNYKCSKCHWELCSRECELLNSHSRLECGIFQLHKILPTTITECQEFQLVTLLRCLLLRDSYDDKLQAKWAKLMRLRSGENEINNPAAKDIIDPHFLVQAVVFVRERCRLKQFDLVEIERLLKILKLNCVDECLNPFMKKNDSRCGAYIFYKAANIPHSCSPNTYWITTTTQRSNGNLGSTIYHKFRLYAAILIRAGQPLTRNYFDILYGTPARRRLLAHRYHSLCFCQRCIRPDEFSTFMSAIKCTKCERGYMLQIQPNLLACNEEDSWICCAANKICRSTMSKEEVSAITSQANREGHEIVCKAYKRGNDSSKILDEFDRMVENHSEVTFHPNHWSFLRIEYSLVEKLLSKHVPSSYDPNDTEGMLCAVRLAKFSSHLLGILQAIAPGSNTIRGRLLCYYSKALMIMIEKSLATNSLLILKAELNYLTRIMAEAKSILLKQPKYTLEYNIGESLVLTDKIKEVEKVIDLHLPVPTKITTNPRQILNQMFETVCPDEEEEENHDSSDSSSGTLVADSS